MKRVHWIMILILCLAKVFELEHLYEVMGMLILLYMLLRIILRGLRFFAPVLILLALFAMFH